MTPDRAYRRRRARESSSRSSRPSSEAREPDSGFKICSDVVAAHHGHIEVVNLEAGGASFRVILPRIADPALMASPRETQTVPPPPSEDIETRARIRRRRRRALHPNDQEGAQAALKCARQGRLPRPRSRCSIRSTRRTSSCAILGLPGMTGRHAAREDLREASEPRREVPVRDRRRRAARRSDYVRASGCATLLKPVDMKDIWMALAAPAITNQRRPRRRRHAPLSTPQSPQTSAPPTLPRSKKPSPPRERAKRRNPFQSMRGRSLPTGGRRGSILGGRGRGGFVLRRRSIELDSGGHR